MLTQDLTAWSRRPRSETALFRPIARRVAGADPMSADPLAPTLFRAVTDLSF